MIRSLLLATGATYALAVFQSALGARLAVADVAPDLLLVWTICIGLLGGPTAGMAAGFGSGLLEGALRQSDLGASTVSKVLSGYLAGMLATRLLPEHWLTPPLAAALVTLAHEAAFLALAAPSGGWARAGQLVGVRLLYHAALAPIALALVSRARCRTAPQHPEVG